MFEVFGSSTYSPLVPFHTSIHVSDVFLDLVPKTYALNVAKETHLAWQGLYEHKVRKRRRWWDEWVGVPGGGKVNRKMGKEAV